MIARIGLVVHGGKPAAISAAERVRRWARERSIPCIDIDVWDALGDDMRLSAEQEAERAGYPELVVTVGGDGTLLRGVRVAAPIGAAVLGVDVGRIGFLTEIGIDQLGDALDAVSAGDTQIESRLMLTLRASRSLQVPAGMEALLRFGRGPSLPVPLVRAEHTQPSAWGVPLEVLALNDVVFEKLARDRQASVAIYVTGRLFGYYSADALIVASSTGSTAYSFAAGGPIVSPELDALIFTPVAPHMIFDRSLVLAARDQRVGVKVLERSGQVALSVDGQLQGILEPGDWVTVYAAPKRARLIRLADTDFLGRVRTRFGLADSVAAMADGTAPQRHDPDETLPPDLAHPGPPDIH